MSHRAERFILDLSDDEESPTNPSNPSTSNQPSNPLNPTTTFQTTATPDSFIKDIIERTPSAPKPPSAPVFKQTSTGFPEHRKRGSRFKAARGGGVSTTAASAAAVGGEGKEKEKEKDGQSGGMAVAGRGVAGMGGRGEVVLDREEEERRQIDAENKRKIASMSPEEIEQERSELLAALDPNLVKMLMKRGEKKKTAPVSDAALVHKMKGDMTKFGERKDGKKEVGLEDYLKRANIDDGRGDTWVETPEPRVVEITELDTSESAAAAGKLGDKREEGTRIAKPKGRRVEPTKAVHWLENDEAEPKDLPDLQPASEFKPRGHTHATSTSTSTTNPPSSNSASQPTTTADTTTDTTDPSTQQPDSTDPTQPIDTLHFPRPPTLPDLDPSSPNFLQDLHTAYFPSLPSSPASLAWLAPLPTPGSEADLESSYSPSQTSIPASALRFDFRGQLLPPRISRAMPTDRGLHHHADAPEAGGYTISELSGLLRSSVPQQRGLAAMR
ncbi:hypothetical protein VF21_10378 [Pseudogymnoascus sp. 05NY08]|nr:hypothetical protein VF21_10378 [Pseudogymnoascus sp. 05NY08]